MRLTIWSGLTFGSELTNGGIKMKNIIGSVDCNGLYTAMNDLSHTCKAFAQVSTNSFANTFAKAIKAIPTTVEPSKSLVSNLPCYKVIYSV